MPTKNIQDVVAAKVEEFDKKTKCFTKYSMTEGEQEDLVDDYRITLTQLVEEVKAGERNRWIAMVGEKIDKTTRDLMLAAFNEGVQVTKDGYEQAIKNIHSELDQPNQ